MGGCTVPPEGWVCSREADHDGPCAATPTTPTPRVTEVRAHVSVGGKVQLVKYEQSGDYSMSISRTYDVNGMSEEEVDAFQYQLVGKLRAEVEPHADEEYQALLTAREELNS